MFTKPTEITLFNTATVRSLTPFRVVVDSLVLKRKVANERCLTLYKENENGEERVLHSTVVSVVQDEDVEDRLPSAFVSRFPLDASPDYAEKTEDDDYFVESGVLVPMERMAFVSGFLQRIGTRIVFVPCRDHSTLVYVACNQPSQNPFKFLMELRSYIDGCYDYEKWYYPLKGIRVKMPSSVALGDGTVLHHGKSYKYDPMVNAGFYPLDCEDVLDLLWMNKTKKKAYYHEQGKVMEDEEYAKKFRHYSTKMSGFIQHYSNYVGADVAKSGVFMRLSSRSPKDFIPQLCNPALTGEDLVSRIVSSDRAFHCLKEYVNSRDPGRVLHVILLPWEEKYVSGSCYEFRCFARNKELNAISQYDCYSSITLLQSPAVALYFRDRIVSFHDQIKHLIPFPSYVIDVVFKPTEKMMETTEVPEELSALVAKPVYECHLIEFNPFFGDMSSGAALFDWKRDYKLIYKNKGKPVMRIRIKNSGGRYEQNRPTVLDLQ